MFDRLLQLGGEARGQRWLGILIACVMVTVIGPTFWEPPLFIGKTFSTPFDSSQCTVS